MADQVSEVPTEEAEAAELTQEQQEEQDALLAVNGDIKGEVRPNRPLEEDDSEQVEEGESEEVVQEAEDAEGESEEAAAEEEAEEVEAPEIAPENDEAGVYAPVTAPDPGDFKPGDYSFTVQTTDGKMHMISSVAEAEALAAQLDTKPELISASQFLALGRKTAIMEQGVAADRRQYEQQKAEYDDQRVKSETRDQYLTQWQGEVNYLREKGGLPPIEAELNNADWTDPSVASKPGVKETLALFRWMEDENNKRMAAGLPPDLSVVSAYNAMRWEAREAEERDSNASEKALNRSRGSMVGRRAPSAATQAPKKGVLVGAPRGLDDLAAEAYYAE